MWKQSAETDENVDQMVKELLLIVYNRTDVQNILIIDSWLLFRNYQGASLYHSKKYQQTVTNRKYPKT